MKYFIHVVTVMGMNVCKYVVMIHTFWSSPKW